ncbi:MAG: DUF1015 domain-containing protein [Bacillota bacterium]
MAVIAPLEGWRYSRHINEMAAVIAPPYDVIDEIRQKQLYARHPYNVVRLDYGLPLPGDDAINSRHTRAAEFFQRWRQEGVLVKETRPALYFYEQSFTAAGRHHTRHGFFCRLKLEPYGKQILPHEETTSAAKTDRLQLLHACRANFSPIWGLYTDPEDAVARSLAANVQAEPLYSFTCDENQTHRLWAVTDEKTIALVADRLAGRRVFIADGHHRFETSLQYAADRRMVEKPLGPAPYDFILSFLVNTYDPGLVVLSTHRLIKAPAGFVLPVFLSALTAHFVVEAEQRERLASADKRYSFGLYTGNNRGYRLTLKQGLDPASLLKGAGSPQRKRLEVVVLHALILEKYLEIGANECTAAERIAFTHDPAEACKLVDSGGWDLAFFLKPPDVKELMAVAEAGERMPQKSSYFYPKIPTGLVFYSFDK